MAASSTTIDYGARCDRLAKEIEKLVSALYNTSDDDDQLRSENLKTYRAEVMRSFILHLHLSIEDLLRALLFDFIKKQNRNLTRKATIKLVREMTGAELVNWCGRLNLITETVHRRLLDLNTIRNKCAHNWVLDIPRFKNVGARGQRKRKWIPVVMYENKNLLNRKVLLHTFCRIYGKIYINLLFRVWRLQGKI